MDFIDTFYFEYQGEKDTVSVTLTPEDPGDVSNTITWSNALGGWQFTTSGEARIQNVIDRNGYVEVVIGRSLENLTLTWSDSVDSVYYCS